MFFENISLGELFTGLVRVSRDRVIINFVKVKICPLCHPLNLKVC